MKAENALPPKGTRDFGPETMAKRSWTIERIRKSFQKFGFAELQTPAMENLPILLGKYGMEGEKLIYKILNSGPYLRKGQKGEVSFEDFETGEKKLTPLISEKGLRYDLTVPFARYVAKKHNELNFPFKRYQIQPVWRADRPQKGRFREFWQCDADTVGSNSPGSDAEMILLTADVMASLGIKDYLVRINNRKILSGICAEFCPNAEAEKVIGALDKLEKIGQEKVLNELSALGLTGSELDRFRSYLDIGNDPSSAVSNLEGLKMQDNRVSTGLKEITEILDLCEDLGAKLQFDPVLARGLDYYTGSIFEVSIKDSGIGSVSGGGRYDDLTGVFGVPGIPGVGISFGLDRINEYLESNNGFPEEVLRGPDYLICHTDKESANGTWELWRELRRSDLKGSAFHGNEKLKKQIQYADRSGINYVIVVGPEEIKKKKYMLKNLKTGDQKALSSDEIINTIKNGG